MASSTKTSGQESVIYIVLLGNCGTGKSASGNTILGEEKFHSDVSPCPVTTKCEKIEVQIGENRIVVIDTPDVLDSEAPLVDIKSCIPKNYNSHLTAFLLVIQLGRFTEEEKNATKKIQELFGAEALSRTIVLFTFGDRLKNRNITDFLKTNGELQQLVKQCGNRYHVFNNTNIKDRKQVTDLLEKIRKVTNQNIVFGNAVTLACAAVAGITGSCLVGPVVGLGVGALAGILAYNGKW
ncbi:GIMA4 GTPase, partial [Polypterus senegalus]